LIIEGSGVINLKMRDKFWIDERGKVVKGNKDYGNWHVDIIGEILSEKYEIEGMDISEAFKQVLKKINSFDDDQVDEVMTLSGKEYSDMVGEEFIEKWQKMSAVVYSRNTGVAYDMAINNWGWIRAFDNKLHVKDSDRRRLKMAALGLEEAYGNAAYEMTYVGDVGFEDDYIGSFSTDYWGLDKGEVRVTSKKYSNITW